jgi:response regulator RpfG family c-di-GMP phosphodiesterase
VYKDAMPVARAVDILEQGRGLHFDPQLLDIFLANMDDVVRIRERFRDTGDQPGIKSMVRK